MLSSVAVRSSYVICDTQRRDCQGRYPDMLLPKQEECIESSPPSFCVSALFIRFRSTLLHVVATMNIDAAQVLPVSGIQTPSLEKKALYDLLGHVQTSGTSCLVLCTSEDYSRWPPSSERGALRPCASFQENPCFFVISGGSPRRSPACTPSCRPDR